MDIRPRGEMRDGSSTEDGINKGDIWTLGQGREMREGNRH
jgi:hypothetical protein